MPEQETLNPLYVLQQMSNGGQWIREMAEIVDDHALSPEWCEMCQGTYEPSDTFHWTPEMEVLRV